MIPVYMMCESNKGIAANALKRMLDVSCLTAWYNMCHRIRNAQQTSMESLSDSLAFLRLTRLMLAQV